MTRLYIETKTGLCIGSYTVKETKASTIYEEIQQFMFDCPELTDVSLAITEAEIRDFITSNKAALHLGTTTGNTTGTCHFTLEKGTI